MDIEGLVFGLFCIIVACAALGVAIGAAVHGFCWASGVC